MLWGGFWAWWAEKERQGFPAVKKGTCVPHLAAQYQNRVFLPHWAHLERRKRRFSVGKGHTVMTNNFKDASAHKAFELHHWQCFTNLFPICSYAEQTFWAVEQQFRLWAAVFSWLSINVLECFVTGYQVQIYSEASHTRQPVKRAPKLLSSPFLLSIQLHESRSPS